VRYCIGVWKAEFPFSTEPPFPARWTFSAASAWPELPVRRASLSFLLVVFSFSRCRARPANVLFFFFFPSYAAVFGKVLLSKTAASPSSIRPSVLFTTVPETSGERGWGSSLFSTGFGPSPSPERIFFLNNTGIIPAFPEQRLGSPHIRCESGLKRRPGFS